MAQTSIYLNFPDSTEKAFTFYKSVFGTEFIGGIHRFGEIPAQEGMPPISDDIKNLIMHIELPILGGHILMGTDAPEAMGFKINRGNNFYISLHPDSREEADQLYAKLSEDGKADMPMSDVFWGDYYGSLTDQFGIQWMINYRKR